jgi:hypothetical protein
VAQKMLISPTRYLVRNIYGGARELFLTRDFRDVWVSARSFNDKRGVAAFERDKFPDDIAWLRGLAYTSRQMRLAHAAAGPGAQAVQYEQLMRDPAGTLARMLAQLGVDSSAARIGAMLAEAARATGPDTASHRTSPENDSVGRWRAEMSAAEKAVAAEAFGEDLRYFGYAVG